MSRDVYFLQHCPVCGRILQVRVHLLGKRVYCQHCGGGFVAMDERMLPATSQAPQTAVAKVDELLERAAVMLEQAGSAADDV
jgi:hypothetical protein